MNQLKKPVFSVIIPTYNRYGVLQEALSSVNAQEGAGELFEMEIVVVDDASSDNTFEVAQKYPDIHYIRLEKNRGQSAAINVGIRASKGEYIALLDDDDLWLPNKLKEQLLAFEAAPEAGVVYGQIRATGDGPEILWPDATRAPSGDAFPVCLMEEIVLPMCIAIRRSAFEKAGYLDEELLTMNHYDFFLRLSFHVPFAFVPRPLAIGRFSENAKWFTNVKRGRYVKNTLFIVERMLKEISDVEKRAALRRKAYISWLGQFNYWLAKAGAFDQICNLFLSMLEEESWLIEEPKAHPYIKNSLIRITQRTAQCSDSPISEVRLFLARVKQKLDQAGRFEKHLNFRHMQSAAWMATALQLTDNVSMRNRRMSAIAAFYAFLNSPMLMLRKAFWRIVFRSVFDVPRWSALIAALKK